MIPDPLHPVTVHFPLVLVTLLPVIAVGALLFIRRGSNIRMAWAPVVVVSALLAGAATVSVLTGEREEEVVEDLVGEEPIHTHEEAGEAFLYLSVATLVLLAAGFAGGRVGSALRVVGSGAAVVLFLAGVQVGRTGGDLVYRYGAAGAYVETSVPEGSDDGLRGRSAGEDDDHESDEPR